MLTADIYIIRVWLEPSQGSYVWRGSISHTQSQERHYFAEPSALLLFLQTYLKDRLMDYL
jgi:hypothetical protein